VAMKALLAASVVGVASADADPACTTAFNNFQTDTLLSICKGASTCAAGCTEGLRGVLTACEGKKYENATGSVLEFETATQVAGWAIFMSDPCKAAAVDVALAGGRCNVQDCAVASGLLGAASVFDCQADDSNPDAECADQCVAPMNAVYQRCVSGSEAATTAVAGANFFFSTKCKAILSGCSYGVGCQSGTTTEAPSSGTTAENPSEDPEVCPPPSGTTPDGTVSFSARAAVLSAFAAAPVAALFA
jgi:hypothetical protein